MSIVVQSPAIVVETKGETLVVDSRLVAENLGIDHSSFFRTVKKYQTKIEQRFSLIRFEIEAVKKQGQRGVKYHEFAWLTEDHALFLMTLSRNTDQVVECKANLVTAFSKARQIIPVQGDRIKELELQNSILEKQLALRQIDNTMLQLHGERVVLALRGMSDQIIEKETVVTEVVDPDKGTSTKILTAEQLRRAIKDRTGQDVKTMKSFTDALRKAGRDDLLIPVKRLAPVTEYVKPDRLDEAIAVVFGNRRQSLLGE